MVSEIVKFKVFKGGVESQEEYFKHCHNPSWKELSYLQKKYKGEFLLVTLNGKVNNIQDFSKLNNAHLILFHTGRKKNQKTINAVVKHYEKFFRKSHENFYEVFFEEICTGEGYEVF